MSTRIKLLVTAVVLLLAVRLGWGFIADRGLITVNVDGKPLSEVVRSVEKQGGIRLQPNFDVTTPVTMHVNKVPLAEALETLAEVTESRWSLAYIASPNRGTSLGLLARIGSGERPEDWVNLRTPMPRMFADGEEEALADPRKDRWDIKAPEEKTLRAYLKQAAANVNATFMMPADWNPAVTVTPGAGDIAHLAPKLVSKAGGAAVEVFLLSRRGERGEGRPENPEGGRWSESGRGSGRGGDQAGGFDPEKMRERMETQIAQLPPEKQVEARAKMAERRKMWEGMRDLPEAERRAKMLEMMSNPDVQARFDERMAAREGRRTPEQRRDRYQKYIQRRDAAEGAK